MDNKRKSELIGELQNAIRSSSGYKEEEEPEVLGSYINSTGTWEVGEHKEIDMQTKPVRDEEKELEDVMARLAVQRRNSK